MTHEAPTIFLSAGEASGEHYGVLLMEEMRRSLPQVRFFGLGGARMAELGFERIVRSEDVAVMGITEVILHMPRIYGEYLNLKKSVQDRRPDVAVLIDFPDVNLRLAEELKRLRIPVVFFVSPQLWAWKKGRIKRVQKFVDRMLVIFPFEESFYRERGVNATYVGHPLADLPPPAISRDAFAQQNGLDASKTWVGMLPGSRAKEIRLNLPEMLQAARILVARNPELEFVLPLAPTLKPHQIGEISRILDQSRPSLPLQTVRDARATLLHARASIVASGTATVEAALIGNPFVVVYRVSALTYWIAQRVVTVPHVAMVNLVADWNAENRLVPELIQDDFTRDKIVQEIGPLLLEGVSRATMVAGLSAVRQMLQSGRGPAEMARSAIGRVASIVVQTLQ